MPDDLPALRRQTKEFIDINPVVVNLNRIDTTDDGQGGVRKTLAPVGNQTFRQVTQPTGTAVVRRTIDGQEVTPEFVLLGEWNANIAHGDWYFKSGIKYEVVYVREDRRYETWGEVAYRG